MTFSHHYELGDSPREGRPQEWATGRPRVNARAGPAGPGMGPTGWSWPASSRDSESEAGSKSIATRQMTSVANARNMILAAGATAPLRSSSSLPRRAPRVLQSIMMHARHAVILLSKAQGVALCRAAGHRAPRTPRGFASRAPRKPKRVTSAPAERREASRKCVPPPPPPSWRQSAPPFRRHSGGPQ